MKPKEADALEAAEASQRKYEKIQTERIEARKAHEAAMAAATKPAPPALVPRPRPGPKKSAAKIVKVATTSPQQKPQSRPIDTPSDARQVAAEWLQWMGYTDAKVKPGRAEGDVDVLSSKAVARVNHDGLTSGTFVREARRLAGGKLAIVFSVDSYTGDAIVFADENWVPLFRYDMHGAPEPTNAAAHRLFGAATYGQTSVPR